MKRFLIFLPLILLFALIETRYLLTDGFTVRKILYTADYRRDNEPLDDSYQNNSPVLNQSFTYLSKGRQTYVFESQDHRYVLKLMRYHKYRFPFWSSFVGYFNPELVSSHFNSKRKKINIVANSYKLALSELKDSTQLEYVHLNKTNSLNKKISVFDKMGARHTIDLDEVGFLIQKKSNSLEKTLISLIKKNESEKVHKIIDSFFERLIFRINKRIINIDAINLIRNSGVDGSDFIEQDVGSFIFVGKDNNSLFDNFTNSVLKFRFFLEKNGGEYLSYFDEKLNEIRPCLKIF